MNQVFRSALPNLLLFLLAAACQSSPPSGSNADTGNVATNTGSGGTTANVGPTGSGSGGATSPVGGSNAGNASVQHGTSGSGGADTSGGSGGMDANSGGPDNPADLGKYFQSGAWMGYVWTSTGGAGSSISPMDFASQTTGMPRCVKGTVAATSDYSGTAILGLNLSEGMGATSASVTPAKEGVIIDVTNTAGSPLRFQVKSSAGTEWCVPLTGSGGFIAWSSLRTNCWDDSGTAYNREPITAAMLLVPGTNTDAVSFDFCWNKLVEADASSGGSGGNGGSGTGGMDGSGGSGGMSGGTGGNGGITVPPLQNGCSGYATRYWDCCKPHCGWSDNAPSGPLASCDQSDNSMGGNHDAANSCTGGSAYLCHSNAPWAVGDKLAYGFAAVAALSGSDICGKCYQLDFTGSSHNGGSDPGSAALAGKSMIVQAINIGGDVGSGQFDIAIPGGGVGAFNACSTQWGVSSGQLGATYGGLLADCKSTTSDHQALKTCVMQKCTSIFEPKGLTELLDGCRWFVDWFQVADNPSLKFAEVACPNALMDRGMHRNGGGGGACLP